MLQTSRFSTLMPTFLFDTLKSKKKIPFGSLDVGHVKSILNLWTKRKKKTFGVSKLICAVKKRLSANFFISLFPHIFFF